MHSIDKLDSFRHIMYPDFLMPMWDTPWNFQESIPRLRPNDFLDKLRVSDSIVTLLLPLLYVGLVKGHNVLEGELRIGVA